MESINFLQFDEYLINNTGDYSRYTLSLNILNLGDLLRVIQAIPYGRNSSKESFRVVFSDNIGTCATKHAFVIEVIKEQGWKGFELILGIYLINCDNTPIACDLLEETELFEVPNAHTYLKFNNKIIDATKIGSENLEFVNTLQQEIRINSDQIYEFKKLQHQKFIRRWSGDNELGCSFNLVKIWNIREQIIDLLSE